ncbi:MAG: bifunctional alpha,alpha-trehalose-phosphate synthase (UDP-forming)/trehalose-phosphatase [Leptospiraceae bacterium]|nr:bifunctional alpha,alpha-trehalose-phosphate synthase (UDP-forming)/trehalose-phosphatase [Leptospiraceae bacterium]
MRLIVVSNRLPLTAVQKDGEIIFQESVGGLVTGISAYLNSTQNGPDAEKMDYIWIGWPGINVSGKEKKEEFKKRTLNEYKCHPVFISDKVMDKFYNGFCNKTIWPLFHYFPTYTAYDMETWKQYQSVNESFCEAIMEVAEPNDLIWIHDYQLMTLPKMVRKKLPNVKIGYFHHIPFPAFEMFRLLPRAWGEDILEGLLGADLIGFHTHTYTNYFLTNVLRISGYEHDMGQIIMDNRVVKADTFPMGIDFDKFNNAGKKSEVLEEKRNFENTFGKKKVIVSIDRLDYSKGVINRLKAFEIFLDKNPIWREKVVMVIVVVPSRVGVESYQLMKRQIDEFVGKINGNYGNITWTPIIYQYKYLSFAPLLALYNVSDAILVTPLRDGMNLVAKEYVASRYDKTGMLILSEMAGAAEELGEAIIINPNDLFALADAIKQAIEMPMEEQIRRNTILQKRLARYNVEKWATDFIHSLHEVREEQIRFEVKRLVDSARVQLIEDFKIAKKRVIFSDYDGTLTAIVRSPELAAPNAEILEIIKRLSEQEATDFFIVSGRDKEFLQKHLGHLNISFIAEHGVWLKDKTDTEWKMIQPISTDWKHKLLPLFELYTDRLPGSFVEEKDFSIAWHYRKAEAESAPAYAQALFDSLNTHYTKYDLQVLSGSKVIEVRSASVNKGNAIVNYLGKKEYDFILTMGDDWTDEDMFRVLPEEAYSIKVGIIPSLGKYNVHTYNEIVELLNELSLV